MKQTEVHSIVERYCDCPHCQRIISDNINVDEDFFYDGAVVECPHCKKKFKITRVNH